MSNDKSDRSRITVIAIALFLLLLLLGGIGIGHISNLMTPEIVAAEPVDYPRQWNREGLPAIPAGEIVGKTSSAADESQFEVLTPLPPAEVGEFLEGEFEDRQWDFYDVSDEDPAEYENEFFDDHSEVIVQAAPDSAEPGKTRVKVAIRRYTPQTEAPAAGFTSSTMSRSE